MTNKPKVITKKTVSNIKIREYIELAYGTSLWSGFDFKSLQNINSIERNIIMSFLTRAHFYCNKKVHQVWLMFRPN